MRKVLVAAVLLVAGCSGDDDSTVTAQGAEGADEATTTTAATIPGVAGDVRILVASGDEVLRVVDGTVEPVAELDAEVGVAYGDGQGAVVAEVDGSLVDLRSGEPVPLDPGGPGRALLFDVVAFEGAPSALYGLRDESDGEPKGDIAVLDLSSGGRRLLATGYAVEHHTFAGSIGGGLLSVSAYSDLTESVTLYPIDETTPDPPWSPTINLAYNAAPLVLDAILAPDAATIAWLSGPEAGEGAWEVVVADLTGREQRRIPLELGDGEAGVRLDYDGERVLVSIAADDVARAPLLIDGAGGTQRLEGITGVATFDG